MDVLADVADGLASLPRAAGTVPQWLTFAVAGSSVWWAARQWRTQYVAKQWDKTIEFLFEHPEYLDAARNADYSGEYEGERAREYGLVARRSIAYVDDLFHLRKKNYLRSWLKGSIELFVEPHLAWFKDHQDSYSTEFLNAVMKEIDEPSPQGGNEPAPVEN